MTAELPEDRKKAYQASIPAGRFAPARGGRRRGALPRLGRRGLHHRRGDPRRRRPRHGPLKPTLTPTATRTQHADQHGPDRPDGPHQTRETRHAARGQEAAHHRGPHGLLDRLPRRQDRAGAGCGGGAHLVRAHVQDHPDDRQAAADHPAGRRARRHQPGGPRQPGRAAGRARRPPRRGAALDRLRPAGRLQLPRGHLRGRVDGDARLGLLAEVPRRRRPAADERRRQRRRA